MEKNAKGNYVSGRYTTISSLSFAAKQAMLLRLIDQAMLTGSEVFLKNLRGEVMHAQTIRVLWPLMEQFTAYVDA